MWSEKFTSFCMKNFSKKLSLTVYGYIPAGASVTFSRTELSVAVVVTFLLTVILNIFIIFVTYCIYHRHKEGIRKE